MNEIYCYFNKIQKGQRCRNVFFHPENKNGSIYLLLLMWTHTDFCLGSFQTAPELLPFLLPFPVHPACSLALSLSRNSATAAAALRQVRCCWSSSIVGPFAGSSPATSTRQVCALLSPFLCCAKPSIGTRRSNKLGPPLLSGCRITRQNPSFTSQYYFLSIDYRSNQQFRIRREFPQNIIGYMHLCSEEIHLPCRSMFLSA